MATPSDTTDSRSSSNPTHPTSTTTNAHPNLTVPPNVTGLAFQPSSHTSSTSPSSSPVPLTSLSSSYPSQTITCPHCHRTTQTRIKTRSKGMERTMNVLWWPLPGRRHWWEKTEWFCGDGEGEGEEGVGGCGKRVARGKWGMGVEEVFDGGEGKGRRVGEDGG